MDTEQSKLPHLRNDWLGYHWSAWMPLMAAHPLALAQLPTQSGLYRVRRVGSNELEWVGWAERGVREFVERLSRQVHLPVEPYDDSIGPARFLWEKRRDQRASFEVSGAALPGVKDGKKFEREARAALRAVVQDMARHSQSVM